MFSQTSKISHTRNGRAVCGITIPILLFHFEFPLVARGVTDSGVGSGAFFAIGGQVEFCAPPDHPMSTLSDPPFSASWWEIGFSAGSVYQRSSLNAMRDIITSSLFTE